jgi:hypothetical protein
LTGWRAWSRQTPNFFKGDENLATVVAGTAFSSSSVLAAECFPGVTNDVDDLNVNVLTKRDGSFADVIIGMAFCLPP